MGNEEAMRAGAVGDCGQMIRSGVIQSTRRRRRASQEANLLTLAQKAVELASMQVRKGGTCWAGAMLPGQVLFKRPLFIPSTPARGTGSRRVARGKHVA